MNGAHEEFELFWESSSLDAATAAAFGSRMAAYEPQWSSRQLTYPGPDIDLPMPRDRLSALMQRRVSGREFGAGRLTERQLGGLLSAFSSTPDGRRLYPSAGALYPLEILGLARHVSGPLDGTIFCYNPDRHTATAVGVLPAWERCAEAINNPFETPPQIVLVFLLQMDRLLAKYGQRGGRFGLIEVGHAAHSLALRLTQQKLTGYELGGLLDRPMLRLLDLEGRDLRVALGYACGLPAD